MSEIWRAEAADWERLRTVRLAALAADPSAFGSTLERELGFTDDRWRSWPDTGACFLAIDAETVLGMAVGRESSATDAELNALWVAPESRGSGIGSALIRAVIAWAQNDGRQRLTLWVTSGNAAGIRVYEAAGFTRTDNEKPLPSDPQLTEVEYELPLG